MAESPRTDETDLFSNFEKLVCARFRSARPDSPILDFDNGNISEGFGRRTNKEFANFLTVSHGSAAETQSHLYVALDLGYLSQKQFEELYKMADEVSRMTMALSQHLRKTI